MVFVFIFYTILNYAFMCKAAGTIRIYICMDKYIFFNRVLNCETCLSRFIKYTSGITWTNSITGSGNQRLSEKKLSKIIVTREKLVPL